MPAAAANRPNRPAHAASSLAPLLQCTIATGSPAGVVTRSSSWCTRCERPLEHDHREDARARADVAGARRDRARRDHAGAGVALGRAEHGARPQRAGRVEQRGALGGQLPARLPGDEHLGQQRGEVEAGRAVGDEPVVPAEQLGVVVVRRGVDREHARRVADAEHLAAGEPPVHVAGEGRDEAHLGDVRLVVEDRLVEVGDRPAQRDVDAEQLGELGRRRRRSSCCATCGTARAARRRRRRRGSRASSPRRRSRRTSAASRRSAAAHRRRGRRTRPAGPTRRRPASRSRPGRRTGSPTRGCRRRAPSTGRRRAIRHALMRVEPSSMPSDVRPARIASRTASLSLLAHRRSSPLCP